MSSEEATSASGDIRAKRKAQSDSVQVFVRVRPFIAREASYEQDTEGTQPIRKIGENEIKVTGQSTKIQCKYDAVFDPSFTQEQVYERVKECTVAVLNGFNATLFAYGQTGSGKSFTMFGAEHDLSKFQAEKTTSPEAGIIPRAIKDIFAGIKGKDCSVFCSFMQIYNESIFDLFRDNNMDRPLNVHEDRVHGIYVEGLSEYSARNTQDCLQLLQRGEENRAVRSTHMNLVSSRSHSVFQLLVETRGEGGHVLRSKFNLVDLAGSEKWSFNSDMQNAHISEMTSINLSLHTLGRCVAALSSKAPGVFVPYRDSKLTRLLQDSLGGNTKTRIIATLSPSIDSVEESISTLKFADRAKQVMQFVRVNESREIDPAYVEKLEREVDRLKLLIDELGLSSENASTGEEGQQASTTTSDAQIRKLQSTIVRLTDENRRLRDNKPSPSTPEGPASTPGPAPEVNQELGALRDKNVAMENMLIQLRQVTKKFFAFEVEEDEMKERVENLFKMNKTLLLSNAAATPQKAFMNSPKIKRAITPGRIRAHVPNNPGPSECGFRVRGKTGDSSKSLQKDSHEKSEEEIQKSLNEAKKAMKKQAKLQAWLIEKEKRELAKLQQEQESIEEHRRLQSERDTKFLNRSKALKAKLAANARASQASDKSALS